MRQLKSRWPYLVLALILSYAVLSLVPPSVWADNLAAVGLVLGLTGVALFAYLRWLRGRLNFLRSWPTPAANAKIRRILSLGDFSPRTARTPRQVALSLLILPLIVLLAAVVGVALALAFSGDGLTGIRETAPGMSVMFFLGAVLLGPVFHGLTFRLRARYDLRSALLSIAIYLPIFIMMMTVLFHLGWFLVVDDQDFLTISLDGMIIPTYSGALFCLLTVLLFRVGISPAPAPALTTHLMYRVSERMTFLVALTSLAIIVVLAL